MSPYAAKLAAVDGLAFVDGAAALNRGRWREFFAARTGRFAGPLILEVGCHDAALLAAVAAQNPAVAFVGLDWTYRHLHAAAQRVVAAGLANVALLRARAQDLSALVAPGELDQIWLFHPDPCHRDVDRPNRLFNAPFLIAAHRALAGPGSLLALKTDHPGYFQHALALLGLPQPPHFPAATPVTGCTGDDQPRRDHARCACGPSTAPPSSSPAPASSAPATRPPRVRPRDLTPPHLLPPADPALRQLFTVTAHSHDYWNDPPTRARTAAHFFAPHTTPYEDRFRRKNLPIYYIELTKNA